MKLVYSNLHIEVANSLRANDVNNCTVVLACSGGLDSTVMADVVCDLADDFNLTLVVAHLHHGLRGSEADGDQRFVIGLAEQHHCKSINHQVDVAALAKESGQGLEAAAREARYTFLDHVAKDQNAFFILVAHTADDVAESFLMNAARGSGIDGLTSHGKTRKLLNATVVRPLWPIQRAQLRQYAEKHSMEWREDSSNADETFLRNRIRSTVIPALREVFGNEATERISRTVEDLMPSRSIVHWVSSNLADELMKIENGQALLNVRGLKALEAPFQTEALRTILKRLLHQPARRSDIQRVMALVAANAGSRATLTGSLEAIKDHNDVVIRETSNGQVSDDAVEIVINGDGAYISGSQKLEIISRTAPVMSLRSPANEMIADFSSVVGKIVWRQWGDGERFQPFGMEGTSLVSDVLTNSRIPHSQRRSVRVLADDEGILWVCGVRTAERIRVADATKHLLSAKVSTIDGDED